MVVDGLLGTVVGLGGAIVQEIVEIKKQKQAFAHELAMVTQRAKIADRETINKIKVLDVQADIEEMKKLYEHDMAIGQNSGKFISSLRASVRPIITYVFFILFTFLKVATFVVLVKQAGALDLDMLSGLWDGNTSTLFSAIMSYWFGRRSIEKRYGSQQISGTIT